MAARKMGNHAGLPLQFRYHFAQDSICRGLRFFRNDARRKRTLWRRASEKMSFFGAVGKSRFSRDIVPLPQTLQNIIAYPSDKKRMKRQISLLNGFGL